MFNSTTASLFPINPTSIGVIAIAMWASLALLSVLTNMVPPFLLLALCFFISGLLVLLKRAWYREQLFTLPKLTYSQWFVGVGGLFGFHFFYFMAIRHAPALQVSLVCYLWPLLLALYVSSPGNRWLTLLGASIGFIGAGVVITDGEVFDVADSFASNDAVGYGYALIAALIWSSYSWYMGKSNNHVEDIGWMSLVVALLALICHLVSEANTLSTFYTNKRNQYIGNNITRFRPRWWGFLSMGYWYEIWPSILACVIEFCDTRFIYYAVGTVWHRLSKHKRTISISLDYGRCRYLQY